MSDPKVTVLMSVYNAKRFLIESIESILSQTYKDFEFIIINDGSADKTPEIFCSYHDPRIRIINNEKNIGLTRSLNKGLKLAKGKYIARQDADDISGEYRIEKQVKSLEANRFLGLVSSSFDIIDSSGRTVTTVNVTVDERDIRKTIFDHNPFCHGAAMFRKEAIKIVGGYRGFFRYSQDYDLWLRISEKYQVGNIEEILYSWRRSDESISEKNLIEQFRYAMAAIEQAKKRQTGNIDDIDAGLTPSLPDIKNLPKGLRRELLNYHLSDIIDSLRMLRIKKAVAGCKNYLKTWLVLMSFSRRH